MRPLGALWREWDYFHKGVAIYVIAIPIHFVYLLVIEADRIHGFGSAIGTIAACLMQAVFWPMYWDGSWEADRLSIE